MVAYSLCWTWAGSSMWARLNPAHIPKEVKAVAHIPKEVEAVVLEATALNCSCTLNVHERDGHEKIKKNICFAETEKIRFLFCTEKPKGVRTVEEIPVLVIGVTH